MTIASEISKLQENLINAYSSIESKGGTLPVNQNFDNLSSSINTITGGSSNIITATNNTGGLISKDDKVWINEENGNYSIENLKEFRNFDVIGSPTINDSTGVVSGFTTISYLRYNNYPTQTISELEILWKVRTPNSFSGYPKALNLSNGTSTADPRIQMDPNGNLYLGLSGQQVYTHTPLSTNTDYWIKIVWNNSVFEGLYSTDGINWVSCGTISLSSIVWSNLPVGIGDDQPWKGSIYLKDCYININGVRWWEPYILYATQDYFTGYAQENIANGSSGKVLTLIQPK